MTFTCVQVVAHAQRQDCVEPTNLPSIDWQNYTETITAFSNSGRVGWFNALPNALKGNNHVGHLSQETQRTTACAESRRQRQLQNRQRVHGHHNSVNNLALCQWSYEVSYDAERKPEYLTQANCLCQKPHIDSSHICEPVFMYVNVYRRAGCNNGVYQYKRVWEPLTVACVALDVPEGYEQQRQSFLAQI
jgi:hypothetical protein